MIRCEDLSVRFGAFRLDGVDLAVAEGESFFLLGPSGAGKTLLLEALLGVRRPDRGAVWLAGQDVTRLAPEHRGVAYVPQDLALFPHLSVRENLLFGLRARGPLPEDAVRRLARWLDLLNLHAVADRGDVSTLSGGERQRVALARALITQPRVLFMDEPFSALDASQKRRLQTEVRALQRSLGLTLVQVTHDPEEAMLMADHMAILMDGRIEQRGTPAELYHRPGNLRVARFLMLQNLFTGRVGPRTDGGYQRVEVGAGAAGEASVWGLEAVPDARFPAGSRVTVGVRPEEVVLVRPDHPPDTERQRNLQLAVVEGWVDLGNQRLVRLRVGAVNLDAALGIRQAREIPVSPGEEIWLHIPPWSLCMIRPDPDQTGEEPPC